LPSSISPLHRFPNPVSWQFVVTISQAVWSNPASVHREFIADSSPPVRVHTGRERSGKVSYTVPSDAPPPLPPLSWPVASGSSRIHRGALECLLGGASLVGNGGSLPFTRPRSCHSAVPLYPGGGLKPLGTEITKLLTTSLGISLVEAHPPPGLHRCSLQGGGVGVL
jgi:hypothetical protein